MLTVRTLKQIPTIETKLSIKLDIKRNKIRFAAKLTIKSPSNLIINNYFPNSAVHADEC